jgi:hypothetical protein
MHLEVICTFWIETTRGTEYADSYAKKKTAYVCRCTELPFVLLSLLGAWTLERLVSGILTLLTIWYRAMLKTIKTLNCSDFAISRLARSCRIMTSSEQAAWAASLKSLPAWFLL